MKRKEDILKSVEILAQAAYDKKGDNITILDMEGLTMLADYFVIVSANNVKQSQSIADAMEDAGAQEDVHVIRRDGYREGEWILLDFGDIMVHVFGGEDTRQFYALEDLWNDAPRVDFVGE